MSGLFILSGCADTALLGYDKTYYNPVPEGDVAVYYDYIPQNCQQIGMTILTISPWSGSLQKEIRELREEAAKIGGNCVNIRNYSYSAGLAKEIC